MNKRLGPPAVLAALVVIVAGCANAPAGTGGSTASPTDATVHQQAVQFADCMRHNGVPAFPDPDPSGGFTIDASNACLWFASCQARSSRMETQLF